MFCHICTLYLSITRLICLLFNSNVYIAIVVIRLKDTYVVLTDADLSILIICYYDKWIITISLQKRKSITQLLKDKNMTVSWIQVKSYCFIATINLVISKTSSMNAMLDEIQLPINNYHWIVWYACSHLWTVSKHVQVTQQSNPSSRYRGNICSFRLEQRILTC